MYILVYLHKHKYVTLPMRAWVAMWCQGTGLYANWNDWLQHHDVGFPEIGWHDRRGQHSCLLGWMCVYAPYCWVAWQKRSARLRVGSDVSICTIEIGWHDRRGQHSCLLNRMCLYAPIRNYELLRNRLAMCKLMSYDWYWNCCYELKIVICVGMLIVAWIVFG